MLLRSFSESPHLQAARGARLPHIVLALVLTPVFLIASQLAGGVVLVTLSAAGLISLPGFGPRATTPWVAAFGVFAALVLAFLPIWLVLWLWMRGFERRAFATIGFPVPRAGARYALGLVLGLLMFGTVFGLLRAAGMMIFEDSDPAFLFENAFGPVLLILLGFVVQGMSEELLLRGWLLQVIGARYRPWLGVIASSIVFAIVHSLNPGISLLAILNLTLFGIFAALYTLREGALWGIGALHATWNWAQGNVFGLEVSGNNAGPKTWDFAETGYDWLTGGAFGPEGGLATTLILAVAIAVILLWPRRRANA